MANLDFINSLLSTILPKKKNLDNVPVPPYVPNQPADPMTPIRQYVGKLPASLPPVDAPTPTVQPPVVPPSAILSPRGALEQQVADIQGKRYNKGIYRDDAGNITSDPKKAVETITAPGADRAKHWSTWEKLAGALEGWAQGGLAGGIKGATDRNFFEKQSDQNKLNYLLPRLQNQQGIDQFNQAEDTRNIANQNVLTDNEAAADRIRLTAQESERKRQKDLATEKYWNRKADQGDLRIAGDDELRALRDKWATSKDATDKRRLDLVEKEMKNRNERLDKTLDSQQKIAGARINSQESIAAENRKQREQQFVTQFQQHVQEQAARGTLNKLKLRKDLEKDAAKFSPEAYQQMLQLLQ